ncbi:hypothetical protein DNTS_034458 [Danionella cerebrum]|uniref:Niban 1/2/3 domain-containing protein n=1 Tax=Danionella cerebrum TaxID=2873325 RepID=A0A553RJQ9_9TELE|nr:hypothetical protein DNTS_034458 [Danionella translucida]
MGASSSLLDESKSNYIKGHVDQRFKQFAPIYQKQYILAYLSQVQDELEQRKETHTQYLKQRDPPEPGQVLYEENVLYFDSSKKWKERFIVMRACYVLECHESYKEDFAPPLGEIQKFPVYLRLPYRQDSYFCFRDENSQAEFISVLSDCIRHQNKDFLKKKTCEVKAFLKAFQLYRQENDQYESWDMLIGSDVRGLANLFMEDLMPYLEKGLQPCMNSKRADKRRVWFAHLLDKLTNLKEQCKEMAKQQEARMRSDMDQITSSRAFLENKLSAMVSEAATRYSTEQIQPHLPAILEEVMAPISLGFKEARELSEGMMDQLCQDFQNSEQQKELHQALFKMSKANLQSCYDKVNGLADHVQELQQAFSYSINGLVDSTEIDLKQLMENLEYTFELLVRKALEDPSVSLPIAMQKASNRVLKQFDYDSSTVRKRIFNEALINITLPSIKKHLSPFFKEELPKLEQYIFADYSNFIGVENVYEDIIHQILEKDVSMVVKEAASMKKYNLFTESKYKFSVSSLSFTPPGSAPSSPARLTSSPNHRVSLPPSPLLTNGLTANKSVTVHSPHSESDTLTEIDEVEDKAPFEESGDNNDVFIAVEPKHTNIETRPEFKMTTIIEKPSAGSSPVIVITEAEDDENLSIPPKTVGNVSDFSKKPTVLIAPMCVTSSEGIDESGTEIKKGIETDVFADDLIKMHIPEEFPIAVCVEIEDAEAGELNNEFTSKQILDYPEKSSECEPPLTVKDDTRPLDCVKGIRDLVVEVIEVEETIDPNQNDEETDEMIEELDDIV